MDVRTAGVLVAVANPAPEATRLQLGAAAPNPFTPRTTIRYELPEAAPVQLSVHDVSGRLVRTLVDTQQKAGDHTVVWDGRDDSGGVLASGVYFVRLESSGETESRRVVLIR